LVEPKFLSADSFVKDFLEMEGGEEQCRVLQSRLNELFLGDDARLRVVHELQESVHIMLHTLWAIHGGDHSLDLTVIELLRVIEIKEFEDHLSDLFLVEHTVSPYGQYKLGSD
jgi:hypothetical protein